MAKKKSTTAKKSSGETATSTAPPAPTHATLQTSLLRCAALCVASKSTLRSSDLPRVSDTPLEDVPTHDQILHDARELFKRIGTTANALALAVKVTPENAKASKNSGTSGSSSTSSTSGPPPSGPGSPLVGLDAASIAAAQAQLDTLTSELLPKLVYVSRKASKESLVRHGKLTPEQNVHEPYANWGGLGQSFAKAINRAVREVVDSVDAFVECFMDLKTRAAVLAAEQARYRSAIERGLEESGFSARPAAHPRIENLTPAQLRKRALIRYDALYKLCDRLADPSPPTDHLFNVQAYSAFIKGGNKNVRADGKEADKGNVGHDGDDDDDEEDDADKLDRFELSLTKGFMNEHNQGLPRDNWEALRRYHQTRSEQLQDAVREIREVLRWGEKNAGKEGEEKDKKPAGTRPDADAQADGLDELDEFDDLTMDDYTFSDVERAKRAIPVVEQVFQAHALIGKLFADPAVRAGFTDVPHDTYDKLAEQAEILVEDIDEMLGYCIYAGDAVTDARQAAEDAADDKRGVIADDKEWEKREADRKLNGDHRPYDPAVAKEIAENAEALFAEYLVAFANSGIELARQGVMVALGDEVFDPLEKLEVSIEEACKVAVGADRYADYSL